jgi:hypothetical protein
MSKTNIRAGLVTTLVFGLFGPPLGGLIVGVWPFGAFVLFEPIAQAQKTGDVAHWLLSYLGHAAMLWLFIIGECYVLGGLPALIAGLVLGLVVLRAGKFSALLAGCVAALAIFLSALITALAVGQPAFAIVPAVVYTSTIQGVPAVLAAILCRRFLLRWEILDE